MKGKYNPNLIRLVQLLSDGEFHDGTQLGEALQMTRSAVWKMIKRLQQYGVSVESVKGRGYRLLELLILLDPSVIPAPDLSIRGQAPAGVSHYFFETIPSTNTFLKSQRGNKEIIFCLAEQQTQGKGRLGREWHSPFGRNIYLSLAYPFQKDISELAGLSLVVALAVVKTLKIFIKDDLLKIKWPNDILYEDKKLAGILIELQAESHGSCQAIIGIGINVNMADKQEVISQPWISLQQIVGKYLDRNEVCALLMDHLIDCLKRFNTARFDDFISEWHAVDYLQNKMISLNHLNQKISGMASGVNSQGYLMVKLPDGSEGVFSSGDVSLVRLP